jgi:hypothetical protein
MGDVQPGESHTLGGRQQLRQGVGCQCQLRQVDQPVQAAQPLRRGFRLVQGRGAGQLNARADQAEQECLARGSKSVRLV